MQIRIPKTLVIGATGYIGRAMHLVAKQAFPHAVGFMRHQVPLEEPDLSNLDVAGKGYEWGIIAAAIPGLAYCESFPGKTWQCNVEGTLSLARQLTEMGIRPLWFSSDQVFDGTASPYVDNDTPSPVNAYGQQKAEVERCFVHASQGTGLVMRLSKVYDTTQGSGTLIDGILTNLKNGGMELAARDLVFCPTHLNDVVNCAFRLMAQNTAGIVNVAAGAISRFDLALMVAQAAGIDCSHVKSIGVTDLKEPFSRPGPVELLPSKRLMEYSFQKIQRAIEQLKVTYGLD